MYDIMRGKSHELMKTLPLSTFKASKSEVTNIDSRDINMELMFSKGITRMLKETMQWRIDSARRGCISGMAFFLAHFARED